MSGRVGAVVEVNHACLRARTPPPTQPTPPGARSALPTQKPESLPLAPATAGHAQGQMHLSHSPFLSLAKMLFSECSEPHVCGNITLCSKIASTPPSLVPGCHPGTITLR